MSFFDRSNNEFKVINVVQTEKGEKKYGYDINPIEHKWDWLRMAEEEIVDGFKYLVAEKDRRDHYINESLDELRKLQHFITVFKSLPEWATESLKKVELNLLVLIGGVDK